MNRKSRGIALIEFAIVLPVLVLILLGIIDLATAMYDLAILTNASREGARWGIISSNNPSNQPWACSDTTEGTTTPCQVANASAKSLLISYRATTSLTTTATGGGVPGSTVTVTMSYTFRGVSDLLIGTIPLSATSKMNYE